MIRVPYGDSDIEVRPPPGVTVETAVSKRLPVLGEPRAAAEEAVRRPLGTPSLRHLAAGKRRVVIAVTDATRLCPDDVLVPPMLAELEAAGVPDEAATILVAVGTHRASTHAEKVAKLGPDIVERYNVVDHDAFDRSNLRHVMDGPGDVPFLLNRRVLEADLVLATGRVEPHQYAGYSGGGKTVAIGCAGEEIISYTHGPAMLDLPGVRLARLEGNPFQEAVRAVARAAKVAFVGNVVLDDEGQLVAIRYGDPVAVQDELAVTASQMYSVPIPRQVDIAVAGVGAPKDVNLYQASRAASYLQFAPRPVVRDGGVIILPAGCPEGPGDGEGERNFAAAMRSGTPGEIIRRIRGAGLRPGEQRAYIMAQVLERVRVILAGADDPRALAGMGFELASSLDEALAMAVAYVGTPAHMLAVPHALLTLPIVQSESILVQ
jgi:nickel-dependent lactate racemase